MPGYQLAKLNFVETPPAQNIIWPISNSAESSLLVLVMF